MNNSLSLVIDQHLQNPTSIIDYCFGDLPDNQSKELEALINKNDELSDLLDTIMIVVLKMNWTKPELTAFLRASKKDFLSNIL